MHGTVMMFLFAVPVVEAMGILLLPQMLGARDQPFPRLGAFAFWAYFVGGLVFFGTLFFDLAPDGRLVHVSAADVPAVLARRRRRLLAARHRLHRDIRHRRRHRDHRRRAAHARRQHVARQTSGLRMDDAGLCRNDHLCLPGRHPRDSAARAGARLRLAVLHRCERRRQPALAAPVLVLRPSRGLHHFPAGGGHGVDDRADHGPHPARRLHTHRGSADRDRLLQLRPVGASHVHHRHSVHVAQLLLGRQHGGVAAERHPGLRLDRHHGVGTPADRHAVAVRSRLSLHLHALAA